MPPENGFKYNFDNVYLCDDGGKPIGRIVDFGTLDAETIDPISAVGYDAGNPFGDYTVEMTFDVRKGTITSRTIKCLQYGWRARGPVRKRAVNKAWRDYLKHVEAWLWRM